MLLQKAKISGPPTPTNDCNTKTKIKIIALCEVIKKCGGSRVSQACKFRQSRCNRSTHTCTGVFDATRVRFSS